MKIFLSGLNNVADPELLEHVEKKRAKVLLSYYHHFTSNPVVTKYKWKANEVFIDSGGFSVRFHGIQIPIENYRDWLLRMKGGFIICANLDPLDMREAMHNLAVLEKAGFSPWPVYHNTEYLDRRWKDVIKGWCKDYEGVCISGVSYAATVKKATKMKNGRLESPYHDFIFEEAMKHGTKIHGLAATNQTLLRQYPFYSADSTTWKNSDRFGVVHEFRGNRLIHHAGVRTKTGRQRDHRTQMPKVQRMIRSIDAWMQYEEYLTQLWAERGVTWQN